MWNCPYSTEYFAKFAEDFGDEDDDGFPSFSVLSQAASLYGITIVGGSMPERDNDRLYNTCCVFGPDGKLIAKHRKVSTFLYILVYRWWSNITCLVIIRYYVIDLQVHLFDCYVPGDISFKESDTFTAGDKPTIVDTSNVAIMFSCFRIFLFVYLMGF